MNKKLQENIINDNEDFQNANQDFRKSDGKFSIISNDSIHKSNIKSDSIDIEESNNNLNDNKKFEEEDEEEDDEFEEERIRAFNEIMNKKERHVEVIKEVDEEYDSDFHMSPNKNKNDIHNENIIHKNKLNFEKLNFDVNDNNKNNNYSHFNVENNNKDINYINNNINDNNFNEDYNKENNYNNDNYQNNYDNNISPIKNDKYLESQSDIVNQKLNYSPLISDANNIQIQTPNFINEKMKFEEKKIPSGDIDKIDNYIRILRIRKNQNFYYENKNNNIKEKNEKENEEEKQKQIYIEKRRKKMEDIKNIFSNTTINYEKEKKNLVKKSKFKELVKITNSVPSIHSNIKKNINQIPIRNTFYMTQRKIPNPKKNQNIKQIYSRRNIINRMPLSNNYYINNNSYENNYNNPQNKLYELEYNNNKKINKSIFNLIENDFFDDGFYNINTINKERNFDKVEIKEIPKYSERSFKRGYIMPVNPINGIISAKAYFLWD